MSYEKSNSKGQFLSKQKVLKNKNSNAHAFEKQVKIAVHVFLAKSSLVWNFNPPKKDGKINIMCAIWKLYQFIINLIAFHQVLVESVCFEIV